MYRYQGKHSPSSWLPPDTSGSRNKKHRARHVTRKRKAHVWLIILLVAIAGAVSWPFIEAYNVQTERVSLVSEHLPADIGHLNIVYLTDIHYEFAFSRGRLQTLVTQINNLKPDLVLFGGDYGTDNASAVRFFETLESLRPGLHSKYGSYGVIGDTDRGKTDLDLSLLTDTMLRSGVTPLINTVAPVRIGNSTIYIAGLDDPLTGNPDIKKAAAQVTRNDYVILLCHSPTVIDEAQNATDANGRAGWFDLALFGHTHGGQAANGDPFNIAPEVPTYYRSGWFNENKVGILVSRGVGTSVAPMRFFCPPQMHYISVSVG